MARCGCAGGCHCTVTGGPGYTVTGNGNPGSAYTVSFAPGPAFTGPGIRWDAQASELEVDISGDQGNTLEFGSDEGMWAPEPADPTPDDHQSATVANLPASNIVGGHAGAGYLLTPESLIRSYKLAITLGLDVVHVPVRALRDGTVVSASSTFMQLTTNRDPYVGQVDTQFWAEATLEASTYVQGGSTLGGTLRPLTGLHSYLDLASGYFGFDEAPQAGATFVTDIAHHIGGYVVLVFEVTSAACAPDLRRIIRQYRLASSSIVAANDLSLLAPYRAVGVSTGGWIASQGDLSRITPQALEQQRAGWVFVDAGYGFTDAQLSPYGASDRVSAVATRAYYQSEQAHFTAGQADGGLGFRGAIAADPVYYNGPESGYGYRHSESTWQQGTVEYGQYNPSRERIWGFGQKAYEPAFRGYLVRGHNSQFYGAAADWRNTYLDAGWDTKGPWWIQQGWLCPVVADADGRYTLAWWSRWRRLTSVYPNFISLAFGVEQDHALKTGLEDGWNSVASRGGCYALGWEYGGAAESLFEDWKADGTVATQTYTTGETVPVNADLALGGVDQDLAQNKVEQCIAVQVDPLANEGAGQVAVLRGIVDRGTGKLTGQSVRYVHPEYAHRGGYVYTGKVTAGGLASTEQCEVTFRHLKTAPGVVSLMDLFPWAV